MKRATDCVRVLQVVAVAAVLCNCVALIAQQQPPAVTHPSASSVQVTPRRTASPLGNATNAITGMKPAVGAITGFVYWQMNVLQPSSTCQGLTVKVVTVSKSGMPLQLLSTTGTFTAMGPVTDTSAPGTPKYMLCSYAFQNIPENVAVRVLLYGPPSAKVVNPPAFQIPGGNCNSTPSSSLSFILTVGEVLCGNDAFNINFKVTSAAVAAPKPTTPSTLLPHAPGPSGMLSQPQAAPANATTAAPGTGGAQVERNPGPVGTTPLNGAGSGGTLLRNPGPAGASQTSPATTNPGASPASNPGPTRMGAGMQASGGIPVTASRGMPPGGAPAVQPAGTTASNNGIGTKGANSGSLTVVSDTYRAGLLKGFVDLHTHPLSNLAFGGKLIYGGVDVGSLLPADPNCNHNVHATSMQQALGHDNSTHGGWGTDNGCGDDIREKVIHALQSDNKAVDPPDDAYGAPQFKDWPVWNDITHQKMWVDWIYRAYQGGLRVMVALAVNNKTLGDATAGTGDYATDDKTSADLQIRETKNFVQRHTNFMEIAYRAADVERIVTANKLAVVLGVEVDNIGNLNKLTPLTSSEVSAEIARLYNEGVRYIFPIHIIDNPFGGTAIYEGAFNMSNYHVNGKFWDLECSDPADQIGYIYKPNGFDLPIALVEATKLNIDIFRNPPDPPACSTGDQNAKGLSRMGDFAIKEMMRHGMLIDIDHMSQKAANQALDIAEGPSTNPLGYPLFSGHNTPRGLGGHSENQRTPKQYARIAKLGGMAGVGTACRNAYQWLQLYSMVVQEMHQQSAALGTDFNGLVKGMPPRYGTSHEDCDSPRDRTIASHISYSPFFPKSQLGPKTWDYNTDGVAHYGMLAEFLMDAKTAPNGKQLIDDNLTYGADAFFKAWQKCESLKGKVH
jgi:microsomal dipeptidase-like Zn-dependent dipeptidase